MVRDIRWEPRRWASRVVRVLVFVVPLLIGVIAATLVANAIPGYDSLLGGIAWYFAGTESPYMTLLPYAVASVSGLISYQRAKAESLGIDAKGGLMERAERIIAILVGLLFPVLLIPILWIMLVLTSITAIQRFVKVWKQAAVAPVTAARIEMRRSKRESRRVARTERRRTRVPRKRT